MIKATAFDLDDTLYPEIEFVYSGFRAVSSEICQKWNFDIYRDLVSRFESGQRGDLFTPVLRERLGLVKETYIKQLVRVYREHQPDIHPFPEIREVLGNLKRSYYIALISDGSMETQERKLAALQLGQFFDEVIFSDQWGRRFWKPHARPFEECLRRLDLDPASMVYIADNPEKDFVLPRSIGMKTIRLRRPGTLHYQRQSSSEFEADREINSLEEISHLLQLWQQKDEFRI